VVRFLITVAACLAWLNAAEADEQTRIEIFPQLGHSAGVQAVAFSPDGTVLASGSKDHTVKLWALATGRLIRTLSGHTEGVTSVAFSPDGKILATGSWDIKGGLAAQPPSYDPYTPGKSFAPMPTTGQVRLWDAVSGRQLRSIAGITTGVQSVRFSPDGKMLATAGLQSGTELWDVATGRELKKLSPELSSVAAFSPDGKKLASAGTGIAIHDVATGETRRYFDDFSTDEAVAFSPDGKLLASGSEEKLIKLWDAASGRALRTISGHTGSVTSVAFSPNGKVLASSSQDFTVKLWDAASGKLLRTLSGSQDFVNAVAFSPDGKTIASGSEDGIITIWGAANGEKIRTLVGHSSEIRTVSISSDGKLLAAGSDNAAIAVWDMASGHAQQALSGHTAGVSSLAYAPGGDLLASGSADRSIKIWDTHTGRLVHSLQDPGWIFSVAISSDGKTLVSGGGDKTVKLWDMADGHQLRIFRDTGLVLSVAISPDGKTIASGSGEYNFDNADVTTGNAMPGRLRLWSVASGDQQLLGGHSAWVNAVAFSPNGRVLASGGDDDLVILWDVGSRNLLHRLLGHTDEVQCLAFSPDGEMLASGSRDGTIRLWDVSTGRLIRTFAANAGHIGSVAFAQNGKVLISGNGNGSITLWDVTSGKQRASLVRFDDGSSITVTPEGFFDSSSSQAEDNLNVRIGNRVFGISSFRDNFYRPDLVQKALAGEDISKYGSIDNVKLSPEVEFSGLPTTTKHGSVELSLNLTNGGGGFGPVRIFWNGTAIQQDVSLPSSAETLNRSYPVPLLSGENRVRATASNADGTMWSDVNASIRADLPAPKKAAGAHGTLHAVILGIGTFPKATEHNLTYAAADAKLMADTLSAKASPLFDHIDIQLLASADKTDRDHIVAALQALQKVAGPNDEFIFYAAGHGIVTNGVYYLATSNVDPADPAGLESQAISAKNLSGLLANIHVPKKLVILDTCDAGATLSAGGLDAKDAATILGRDYGFTVLAATTSNQEALEGGYKGNGLFTYVVADGLAGKAADRESGIVSSFLLADYVNDNVPTLAQTVLHRSQQPTAEKSGQTFPITKVK
jgi:WD40 repeat protein